MNVDGALVDIDLASPRRRRAAARARTRGRAAPSGIRAGGIRSGRDRSRGRRATRASSRGRARCRRSASTSATRSGAGAAQQRAHAGDQLGHRERLDDVVVGAGRKPAHALAFLAARGEHDDRQRLASPAAPAAGGTARCRRGPAASSRAPRDRARASRRRVSASSPRGDGLDVVAFGLEVVAQQQRQRLFVLDDQDACAHRAVLAASRSAGTPWRRPWCRPSAAGRRSGGPRPCNARSRRCWWRGRPCARCSWRRTSDGCRR